MKKTIRLFAGVVAMALLFIQPGCTKKAKYDVAGKWAAKIIYNTGQTFTPGWEFKEDLTFFEFGGAAWGSYSVQGDKIKIISKDGKEYYSGTVTGKTHMSGNFFYVGFENNKNVSWEAVKVDE